MVLVIVVIVVVKTQRKNDMEIEGVKDKGQRTKQGGRIGGGKQG